MAFNITKSRTDPFEELTRLTVFGPARVSSVVRRVARDMHTCDYCGKENPEGVTTCLGCGSRLGPEETVANDGAIGPCTAAVLAMASIWFPFLVGAAMSGDRDIINSVFMLPGMIPSRGSEVGAYVCAGMMSFGIAGAGIAAARKSNRFFYGLVGIGFVVSCGLALVTILGMLT